MAVRIEYLLVFVLVILLLSILGINPRSQEAKISKRGKEVEFINFFLYDIKENEPAQEMFAIKTIKYQNYLDMEAIDLKAEKGYRLLAEKAIYKEEYIYLDKGVKVVAKDSFNFITKSLNYNLATKDMKTFDSFRLEFNESIIVGDNLQLNTNTQKISADHIEASIYFIPEK